VSTKRCGLYGSEKQAWEGRMDMGILNAIIRTLSVGGRMARADCIYPWRHCRPAFATEPSRHVRTHRCCAIMRTLLANMRTRIAIMRTLIAIMRTLTTLHAAGSSWVAWGQY
jgi:hypothetical protein